MNIHDSLRRSLRMLVVLPLFSCGFVASAAAPVSFESFEYAGHDVAFDPVLPEGHFRNPILAGFYPDPSICRAGDDYYLVNSSFVYFPGIPLFHSRDLVNWKQIGNVISRPSQLNYDGLAVSQGIYAPALTFHDGVFYLVCTMVGAGDNFLMTATDPVGPWSDPIWLGFGGIDPSLFFDDDGRSYILSNGGPEGKHLYEGHCAIWLQEFDFPNKKMKGARKVVINGGVDLAKKPWYIEGPHVYKRDGYYYLFCAEGGTEYNHSEVIFRSQSIDGPYLPGEHNPILTQRDLDGTAPQAVVSTGHADIVFGPDGKAWSVFLGCRPFAGKYYTTGRETFLLPMEWPSRGWPTILDQGKRVPAIVPSPNGVSVAAAPVHPLTGNFSELDDFKGQVLAPSWLMLRQPHERWWKLNTSGAGGLQITPRVDRFGLKSQPSFLGRRVQHARFQATTTFVPPSEPGTSAGMVAFQNEKHQYYFGVRNQSHELTLFLEKINGPTPEPVVAIALPTTKTVRLQLTARDDVLTFSYAVEGDQWHTLVANGDATVLTTEKAGGFVGALVGLHARIDNANPPSMTDTKE